MGVLREDERVEAGEPRCDTGRAFGTYAGRRGSHHQQQRRRPCECDGDDEQFSKTYAQKDFGALTFFYSATPVFLPNTDWGFVTNAVDVGHYFALKMYEEKNITTFERRPLHALVDSGNPTGVLHELGVTTMGTAGGQSTSCYHYTRWVKQAAGWRIDVDVLSVGLLGPPASG